MRNRRDSTENDDRKRVHKYSVTQEIKKEEKLNFSNIKLECKQTVNIETIRDKNENWKKKKKTV